MNGIAFTEVAMGSVPATTAAVVEVAVAAVLCPPESSPVGPVLEAVRRVVDADVAGYYVHEWHGWTTAVHISPAEAWRRIPNPRLPTEQAAAMHPGIRHVVDHPTGLGPFALTDLVSEREWLESPLGRAMRPDWGRNHQLAIPVPAVEGTPESRVWVLGRSERHFSAADRELAAALQALLTAVSRVIECHEQHRVPSIGPPDPLTRREQTVLRLLNDGNTAIGAAAQLGISARTVNKHVEHIYRKLGVHNVHAALLLAADLSLLR